jgi:hypothetical protein
MMGTLLSLITIVTLIGAFAVTIISHGSPTLASSASISQASQTAAFAVRNIQVPSSSTGSTNLVSSKSAKNLPARDMGARTLGHLSSYASAAPGVHSTSASPLDTTPGNLLQNFAGLTNLANAALNPFVYEPPDQGLCVGYLADLHTGKHIPAMFEMVNNVIAIYLTNGKLVIETSLGTFFGDINFPAGTTAVAGDPRCHFDMQTHTFFFSVTVIGTTSFLPGSLSRVDLAAINANTQKGVEILLDTTNRKNPNCPCFADEPLFGIDSNAVFVSTNVFSLTNGSFQNVLLIAFAKEPIVNRELKKIHVFEGSFPRFVGNRPVFGVQPAINVSFSNGEYLENAVVSNNIENTLILWHVTDQNIANGVAPKLNLQPAIIKVENYATPVPAASTGSGVSANGITSAALLDAGDSRIQQVQGIQDEGSIELWSALSTNIKIQGDPKIRDGIAWFRIDPQNASVVEQGYVFSAGNYLLYPTILHTSHGATAIVFSVTNSKLNPSAAYIFSPSSPTNFGSIFTAALGVNPYLTATANLRPNGSARWGDYSAAALSQGGTNIWLATEFIPVQSSTNFVLNWGTQVFEVKGS